MAKGFKKGAGGANLLNFKVVGGTSAPASPKENTIWVNTSTAITSWVFSATEPGTKTAGMVWIATDRASTASFNALKKNNITVYPITAKQYVSGAWVNKTAKSYQGGKWVSWFLTLAPNPDRYGSGAWTKTGATVTTTTQNTEFVFTTAIEGAVYALVKVDVGGYTKLKLNGTIADSSSSSSLVVGYIGLFSGIPSYSSPNFVTGNEQANITNGANITISNEYDISAVSGEKYIGVLVTQGAASKNHTTTFTMTKIELS